MHLVRNGLARAAELMSGRLSEGGRLIVNTATALASDRMALLHSTLQSVFRYVTAIPLPQSGELADRLDPSLPRNVEFIASQTEAYRPARYELSIRAAEQHVASLHANEIASDNWAALAFTSF